MKSVFFLSCLIAISTFAQEDESEQEITPALVESELDRAEREFQIAKAMFIPYYTGPLITGSADNAPPGVFNVQGYLYFNTQYGTFNENWSVMGMDNIYTLQPLLLFQTGITHWLDISVAFQGFQRWQKSKDAGRIGDTTIGFGFQIYKETPWIPSIRATITEVFPSGRFENLNPVKGGIDATGGGAYQTAFGLNVSKAFWHNLLHPSRARMSFSYTLPNHKVDVENFNAYGGGFGTNGEVNVGDTIALDFGYEISLTQKWVFACDFVYAHGFETTFSGNPGISLMGGPATVGGPSNDQISLAPAIEYNTGPQGGFIGGVWFSLAGRNSSSFVALVLSYTQAF